MSVTMCSLLAVCVVACFMHQAPVLSQCTTIHCHDGDSDVSAPAALVDRLQDTVERQVDSLEQQQRQNQELQGQLATLRETVEQQQQQLKTLNETMYLQEERLMAQLDTVLRELKKVHENTTPTTIPTGTDCADLLKKGHTTNGVYNIRVGSITFPAFCDMLTENGGWMVFQRRVDNTTDFFLDWKSYKEGFGDLTRNFWLGNDNLHAITAQKKYTLRVDLADFEGQQRYAKYTDFAVGNEANKYRLTLGSYSGTAGDSLSYHDGMAFSTRDKHNDRSSRSCAQQYKGAWWYNKCHQANLNALYLPAHTVSSAGINWYHWHGYTSLKTVAMKIRPE